MPGDALQLILTGVGGGTVGLPELPLLMPLGPLGRRVLNLSVRHLPRAELCIEPPPPPDPAPSTAHHFGVYYQLFDSSPTVLLPADPREEACPPDPAPCGVISQSGESAFNCMLGAG